MDWNESHEKKTKHIRASAANLLHIRTGNLVWCKCGHCKNKARGGIRKGDESKISFCYPKGLRASPHTYRERGGVT